MLTVRILHCVEGAEKEVSKELHIFHNQAVP